jgi:hypothetical protein
VTRRRGKHLQIDVHVIALRDQSTVTQDPDQAAHASQESEDAEYEQS